MAKRRITTGPLFWVSNHYIFVIVKHFDANMTGDFD